MGLALNVKQAYSFTSNVSYGERMQNRLCEIRTQRGMTQEELALAVHVKGATISRWENNINHIPLAKLPTLARVLQVQAWDIVPQLQTWQPLSQEVTQEVAHG